MKQRALREACRRLWRGVRRRWALSAALLACALAALAAVTRALLPPAITLAADFPAARPADLAHLLADISANTHLIPGSWTLEEEAGNYTWWRYVVSYGCGARCAGRVTVAARTGAGDTPRHGAGDTHRVTVADTRCSALPMLPWPQLCEEVETESVVSAWGGGSRLVESTRARCNAPAAALLACSSARELRARAEARHRRLPHLLPPPPERLRH